MTHPPHGRFATAGSPVSVVTLAEVLRAMCEADDDDDDGEHGRFPTTDCRTAEAPTNDRSVVDTGSVS